MNEFEITVKVDLKLNDLLNYLLSHGFHFHVSFRCNDIYLIKSEDKEYPLTPDGLNKCVILREFIFKDELKKFVINKNKKYDENGNILDCETKKLPIRNTREKLKYFLDNGYEILEKMNDYCYTFSYRGHEFIVEYVREIGTFIEVEDHNYYSDKVNGTSVEDLIELLDSFNIPYDKSDYFCKKILLLVNR